MVERIRLLLEARQLSPTQFADTIGVARPVVSHILGGRNKPSLEVVQKIIAAFPDLALPWLLSGEGPMLAGSPANAPAEAREEAPAVPGAFLVPKSAPKPAKRPRNDPADGHAPEGAGAATNAATENEPAATAPAQPRSSAPDTTNPAQPPFAPPATPPPLPDAALPFAAATPAGKIIRRVVVFYHDGTFSDYRPAAEPL